MRFALTCNGPGEFAGWVRPLARTFEELAPSVELHCFFVPDDYATGREAEVARESLPGLRIHSPKEYLKFAAGMGNELKNFDGVLYLGGDVLHAARIHARLGGAFFAYRYAPKHIAKRVQFAFALDKKNAKAMRRTVPSDRIETIGNLAVDGAIAEAGGTYGRARKVIENGVLFMPGSRKNEITNLVPFFGTAAVHLRRLAPELPIAFGISPFTELSALSAALNAQGDPHLYSAQGRIVEERGEPHILMQGSPVPFPIVRDTLQSAVRSCLAVTIPGTKSIELAALGVPHIVCTPFNLPEKVVINGVLTYLDRLPVFGTPLKRAAVLKFSGRFRFFAQPNIDAGEEIVRELAGTLTPGHVAQVAYECAFDSAWQAAVRPRLADIYRDHAGAARRMVSGMLRESGAIA